MIMLPSEPDDPRSSPQRPLATTTHPGRRRRFFGAHMTRKRAEQIVGNFWPEPFGDTPEDERRTWIYRDGAGWQVSFFGVDEDGEREELICDVRPSGMEAVS